MHLGRASDRVYVLGWLPHGVAVHPAIDEPATVECRQDPCGRLDLPAVATGMMHLRQECVGEPEQCLRGHRDSEVCGVGRELGVEEGERCKCGREACSV